MVLHHHVRLVCTASNLLPPREPPPLPKVKSLVPRASFMCRVKMSTIVSILGIGNRRSFRPRLGLRRGSDAPSRQSEFWQSRWALTRTWGALRVADQAAGPAKSLEILLSAGAGLRSPDFAAVPEPQSTALAPKTERRARRSHDPTQSALCWAPGHRCPISRHPASETSAPRSPESRSGTQIGFLSRVI